MKKFTVWIKKHKKLAVFLCIAIIIAAAVLTLAACTPKFYPPQVAPPESYVYGAGFSSE